MPITAVFTVNPGKAVIDLVWHAKSQRKTWTWWKSFTRRILQNWPVDIAKLLNAFGVIVA